MTQRQVFRRAAALYRFAVRVPLLSVVIAGWAASLLTADEPIAKPTTDSVTAGLALQAGSPIARWDMNELESPPEFRWLDDESPIRSLLYQGEDHEGHPTEVFAFYATPGTLQGMPDQDKELPAIVLLHGGGGTAFAEWVELWAKRGYAAIAMDLGGKQPPSPLFDPKTRALKRTGAAKAGRKRLQNAGPLDDHQAKFFSMDGNLSNDWQFHAVSAAIRAHSLLRSFREVDAERTAVTGISWGGYLTCLVASVDSRFKAAVPVYGCGYLYDGESVQRSMIDRLGPAQREAWIRLHDPSAFLPYCKVPILFVNGTNDKHYPIRSYAKSYELVASPKSIRVEAGMKHSHGHGWAPAEIGRFIDQHLLDGDPLVTLGKPVLQGSVATATFRPEHPPTTAGLQYTVDQGPLVDRVWETDDAEIAGDQISAKVPEDATIWTLTASDEQGAMISSEIMFRNRNP